MTRLLLYTQSRVQLALSLGEQPMLPPLRPTDPLMRAGANYRRPVLGRRAARQARFAAFAPDSLEALYWFPAAANTTANLAGVAATAILMYHFMPGLEAIRALERRVAVLEQASQIVMEDKPEAKASAYWVLRSTCACGRLITGTKLAHPPLARSERQPCCLKE